MNFCDHNIQLDDGRTTFRDKPLLSESDMVRSMIRTLNVHFSPAQRPQTRIIDLGCLEGGYSVAFARAGYQVVGLDARQANIAKCDYVRQHVDVASLEFVCDDAWNIKDHGIFDIVFCSGLLYHLDRPAAYLKIVGQVASKMLMLQTHFALPRDPRYDRPYPIRLCKRLSDKVLRSFVERDHWLVRGRKRNFGLSPLTENEGKTGRWYKEFSSGVQQEQVEESLKASYGNLNAFWLNKKDLLQSMLDSGFPVVYEQYDFLGDISRNPYIEKYDRSLFIGLKLTGNLSNSSGPAAGRDGLAAAQPSA